MNTKHKHLLLRGDSLRSSLSSQLIVESAGKVDPQRHLQDKVEELMSANILQCLGTMLNTVVF